MMMMKMVVTLLVMICCHVDSVSAGFSLREYGVKSGGSSGQEVSSYTRFGFFKETNDKKEVYYSESYGAPETRKSPHCCNYHALDSFSSSSYGVQGKPNSLPSPPPPPSMACLFFTFIVGAALIKAGTEYLQRDSVIMLQVVFDGVTRRIQRDLDIVSKTKGGLHWLLSVAATTRCVYRHPKSCFAAYSSVNKIWRFDGGWEKCFDQTYHLEQEKVNACVPVYDSGLGDNKYVIVTILIAASGVHNLPAVNDYSDLVSALDSLTSINYKCIEAVKVLWTNRDDIRDLTSLRTL
uniref:Uncharacterized protein n=1 Tax=Fagus sylvatica TaxID=28930 RepID=A0A2N9FTQ7_FAGSY